MQEENHNEFRVNLFGFDLIYLTGWQASVATVAFFCLIFALGVLYGRAVP